MWFSLQPIDLKQAQRNGQHVQKSIEIPVPAAKIFEYVSSDEHMPKWFQDLRKAQWQTEKVSGGKRVLNLYPLSIKEHFLTIEPNRRLIFYFEASTLPGVEWMLEDMHFIDNGNGTCTFEWNQYFKLKPGFSLAQSLVTLFMKNLVKRGVNSMRKYAMKNA